MGAKEFITSKALTLLLSISFSPEEWAGGGGASGGIQGNKTNQDFTIKANTSN